MDQATAAAVSAAYGGSSAGVTTYTAEDLSGSATAVVVRASSPALWVIAQDAAWLGVVLPLREVRTVGDAQCSIQNDPTVAGKQPAPDSVHVLMCQRTSPTLTVQVLPNGAVGQDPTAVVAMVDSLFQSASGG
jgi:phage gp37-like protein